MVELAIEKLTVTVDRKTLVDAVSFRLRQGELVALVGPNGAGKSSLLRAIAGVESHIGAVLLDGEIISNLPPQKRARRLAWLPQTHPPAWPVRVRDAVAVGRYAWGGAGRGFDPSGQAAIDGAIALCDLDRLVDRQITSLSGGELARVHLARMLASDAPVMLADEPVAALDPAHRVAVMRILQERAKSGAAILVVLHDIGLAARYADRLIGLRAGKVVAEGAPSDVVTSALMRDLFDVDADIVVNGGAPVPVNLRLLQPREGARVGRTSSSVTQPCT